MNKTKLYVVYEVNPTNGGKRAIKTGLTLEEAQDMLARWRELVHFRDGICERERTYCDERYWQFTSKSHR